MFTRITFGLAIALSIAVSVSATGSDVANQVRLLNPGFERVQAFALYLDTLSPEYRNDERIGRIFTQLKALQDRELQSYLELQQAVLPIFSMKNPDDRNIHLQSLLTRFNDDLRHGILLHSIAHDKFNQHEYVETFHYALEAQKFFKRVGFSKVPGIVKYLHELSLIHYFFSDYERVLHLMDSSFLFPDFGRRYNLHRYNDLGLAHQALGNWDKAESYFARGLAEAKAYPATIWQGIILENLGTLRARQLQYREALSKYRQAISFVNPETSPNIYSKMLLLHAKMHLALNETEQAGAFIKSYLAVPKPQRDFMGFHQQQFKTQVLFSEVARAYYFQTGAYKTAYLYADTFQVLSRKLDSTYNMLQLERIHQQLNAEQLESQLFQLMNEKQILLYRLALVAMSSILIFAGLVYFNHLKRKRATKLFKHRENNLMVQQQLLSGEIDQLKASLKEHIRSIEKANQQVELLKRGIITGESVLHDTDGLTDTEQMISPNFLTKEAWQEFRSSFEQLYPQFSEKVYQHPAAFSEAETRLIMLTKLEYSSKEAQRILGVSDSAVRITWLRIRRKMNVPASTNPLEILQILS